jgi:hypothetical protein
MLGNGGASADSATTVLRERTGGIAQSEMSRRGERHPSWRPARRDPRSLRFVVTMVIGLFVVAIAVSGVVNYLQQVAHQRDESSAPSGPLPPEASVPPDIDNPSPDTAEPEHTSALAITLREWLNMQGYSAVHFSLNGDTVTLWGTVPNEFERRWVRTQATMLTGATSVIDHMVIQPNPDALSEP